jgi:hypothetical protein
MAATNLQPRVSGGGQATTKSFPNKELLLS